MIIKSLLLRNFRNFKKEKIFFEPYFNVIIGDNAQGKTNILEALFLLSTGRSFRTSNMHEMIMDKESFFFIEVEIIKDLVTQRIQIYYDKLKKKITHNKTNLSAFTNLFGIVPSVIHTPIDIHLISGMPSCRRRFLNIHLAQRDPLYIYHLSRFYRALKQRNFLLKSSNIKNIGIWENELAKSGAYITNARKVLLKKLSKKLENISWLNDKISLKYFPGFSTSNDIVKTYNSYLEQLKNQRKKDLIIKTTQFGPHRDDFLIYINTKNAKKFASEGQKRIIILSIKIIEHNILSEDIRGKAIMIIDDLGIHLDKSKLSTVQSQLKNLDQVFISTPDLADLFQKDSKTNIIPISNGKLSNI